MAGDRQLISVAALVARGLLRPLNVIDGVEVWLADLHAAVLSECEIAPALSQDERERAERYGRADLRDAFIARRAILRILLAGRLGAAPVELPFHYGEFGKPELEGGAGLHFNLSHSGSAAIYAISARHTVGIDIERVQPRFDYDELAPLYLTERERARILATRTEQRARLFFSYWARKEAIAKRLGLGLSADVRDYDVSDLAAFHQRFPDMRVYDIEAGEAYCAALAVGR